MGAVRIGPSPWVRMERKSHVRFRPPGLASFKPGASSWQGQNLLVQGYKVKGWQCLSAHQLYFKQQESLNPGQDVLKRGMGMSDAFHR